MFFNFERSGWFSAKSTEMKTGLTKSNSKGSCVRLSSFIIVTLKTIFFITLKERRSTEARPQAKKFVTTVIVN